MKTIKNLLTGVLITGALFAVSCKDKDDDPQPCNYPTELQAEIDAYTAAATAYFNDPSNSDKCLAYKNSLLAYIDAAGDYEECATLAGQHAEFQASLDAAQASANAIQC